MEKWITVIDNHFSTDIWHHEQSYYESARVRAIETKKLLKDHHGVVSHILLRFTPFDY
jgi:hypothetical protein